MQSSSQSSADKGVEIAPAACRLALFQCIGRGDSGKGRQKPRQAKHDAARMADCLEPVIDDPMQIPLRGDQIGLHEQPVAPDRLGHVPQETKRKVDPPIRQRFDRIASRKR